MAPTSESSRPSSFIGADGRGSSVREARLGRRGDGRRCGTRAKETQVFVEADSVSPSSTLPQRDVRRRPLRKSFTVPLTNCCVRVVVLTRAGESDTLARQLPPRWRLTCLAGHRSRSARRLTQGSCAATTRRLRRWLECRLRSCRCRSRRAAARLALIATRARPESCRARAAGRH